MKCKICGKEILFADKRLRYCSSECVKVARREQKREYNAAHREQRREYKRKYYAAHREYHRGYNAAHCEQKREYQREYQRRKRLEAKS